MNSLRNALRELPGHANADLLEAEDAYRIVVDVPGATPGSTEVRAEGGRLHVEAERPGPEGEYDPVELNRDSALAFDVPLPLDADGDAASASVERGVLEVHLPRRERGTEIPIED